MKKEKTDNIQKLPLQITDAIWDRIQPILADCPNIYIGNPEKYRLFLSAVLWIAKIDQIVDRVLQSLNRVHFLYYRPHAYMPALRLEMSQTIAKNRSRLGVVLQGIKYQCSPSATMEPYPLIWQTGW